MDAEAWLRTYAELADARLNEILAQDRGEPERLKQAMRYAVLGAGKRVRPGLCMASAAAVGADWQAGLDAGCAVELVHCFSLVHDDLPAIDNDELRRGKPTCHIEFGEAIAILAGDALFALAFDVLAHAAPSPERGLMAVRALADASGPAGLVGGEVSDILAEGQASSKADVTKIHERKTGALIRAACEIGAIYGGATPEKVKALGIYGGHAGLAFQISDDLLNELSTSKAIGKSTGSDRQRQKATYPTAFGVENSKKAAQEEVEKALASLSGFGAEAEDLRLFARYVVERLR